MSDRCYKCFKPLSACLCKYTREIDPGIKFVFLMHPKEFKRQRTGTGNLAHITLKNSEIIVGLDFEKNERLQELLNDPQYFPVMMYPGQDAWTAGKEGFSDVLKGKTLLVIILDATWFCSKKMIDHNPFLLQLPRFSFSGDYRSIFTFKREPKPEYISTIETCYYLIKELKDLESGISQTAASSEQTSIQNPRPLVNPDCNPEPLMNVFKAMIKDQLQCENDRIAGKLPSVYAHDWKYDDRKAREIPDYLE